MEARFRRKSGEVFDCIISVDIINIGGTECLISTIVDITERKRAEKSLRESEEMVRAILDATTESVLLVDKQGTVLALNKTAAQRFGKSVEEIVGLNALDAASGLVSPDLIKSRLEHVRSVIRSGKPVRFEDQRGGIILDSNMFPIFDEKGQVTRLAIFARDITEQKKMEDALKESEEKYRTLVENASDQIFMIDKEYKLVSLNKAALMLFGKKPNEIIGRHISEIFPKETAAKNIKNLEKVLKAGKPVSVEEKIIVGKREFWSSSSLNPVKNDAGKTVAIIGVVRDITEKKKTEEALQELKHRYQTLFESAPVGIGVSTPEGKVLECNNAMLKMLGYSETEVKQINLRDTYKDPQRRKELLKQLQRDGFIRDFEVQLKQKDGTAYYASLTIAPFTFNGQNVLLAVQENITERKQAQEMLNSYREKMMRAEQLASLGTLSATFAHELTQPLTVIGLSIENTLAELRATSYDSAVIEQIEDGLMAVANATLIIDRFRNFARKSSARTINKVHLKTVAERVIKLLNEHARRARVSLRMKGMGKLPPVDSNEKELEQLFFALIDNAIQAADGKKDRKVVVSGSIKDEHIELRFSDNCGGITPENIDKIFEPFFTTKPPSEGTGLGLCIVQRIVSGAGGKVWVKSKHGIGSTFFVTLPIGKDGKY
jgi:PAS domain S-box-containing protein